MGMMIQMTNIDLGGETTKQFDVDPWFLIFFEWRQFNRQSSSLFVALPSIVYIYVYIIHFLSTKLLETMGLRSFSPTWALDGGWVLGNNDEKKRHRY